MKSIFSYFLFGLISFCLFLLSACGSKQSSWQTTDNGIKVWIQDAGFLQNYVWKGSTQFGYAHGKGQLHTINRKGNIENTIQTEALFGLIRESDIVSIDYKYKYWGEMDDDKVSGEGIIRINDSTFVLGKFKNGQSDSVCVSDMFGNRKYIGGWKNYTYQGIGTLFTNNKILFKGKFKKGKYEGDGILYFPNGNIQYSGDWKNGLYDGKGVEYYEGGIIKYIGKYKTGKFDGFGTLYTKEGKTISHVWKQSQPSPLYNHYYEVVENNRRNLDSDSYSQLIKRVEWYEHYDWVVILILLILHLSIIFVIVSVYSKYGNERYWYLQSDKIQAKKYYVIWLLAGFYGFHRYALGSLGGLISFIFLTIALFVNVPDLVTFYGYYNYNVLLQNEVQYYITIFCLFGLVICWLFDSVWILYRVYFLNAKYYRVDCREAKIIMNQSTDVDEMINDLESNSPRIVSKINSQLKSSKDISKEKKQHTTNIGSWLKFGEKKFLEEQNQRIVTIAESMQEQMLVLQDFTTITYEYLEEARINAYRNLNLAKEIIGIFKEINSKQQTIHKDTISFFSSIQLSEIDVSQLNYKIDFASMQHNIESFSSLLETFGASQSTSQKIGKGAAVAIEGINALYQRHQAMLALANNIKNNVTALEQISHNALIIQQELLRMKEILVALHNANIAFLQVYSKLRDHIFGTPSFLSYIKGVNKNTSYIQSSEFTKDIIYLQQVCSQYNKINQSNIH